MNRPSANRDIFHRTGELYRPCHLPACAHRSRFREALRNELRDWPWKLVFLGAIAALVAKAILRMRG